MMEKKGWKIIAIVFIAITAFIIFFNAVNYISYSREEAKMNECFYDICDIYPDADYAEDVCYCYDYSVLGELVVVDTEYMGK